MANEHHLAEFLLILGVLFALTYCLAGLLVKVRIPAIIAALFIGMFIHYTTLGERLLSPELSPLINVLAQLGVLFLLFFIGLQIDLQKMRSLGADILYCTGLNTIIPFIFGMIVMLLLGYGWLLAFIIGLTRMPTAEAVIVPILDEFQLLRTRVGEIIIGVGTLDDVIEIVIITIVSIWISGSLGLAAGDVGSEILAVVISLVLFLFIAWLSYRWIVPRLANYLPVRVSHLMMLCIVIMFSFGGLTEFSNLGMVIGALVAGIIARPAIEQAGVVGEQVMRAIQSFCYGFVGLIFFYWIGLSVDLMGLVENPLLTIALYLAGTLGKLAGVFLMVPMKRLNVREAWTVGVGLDARLTTEIIVARLLLDAQLIDAELFTALVSAASITAITIPVIFTLLVRRWGDYLVAPEKPWTQ